MTWQLKKDVLKASYNPILDVFRFDAVWVDGERGPEKLGDFQHIRNQRKIPSAPMTNTYAHCDMLSRRVARVKPYGRTYIFSRYHYTIPHTLLFSARVVAYRFTNAASSKIRFFRFSLAWKCEKTIPSSEEREWAFTLKLNKKLN